MIMMQMEGSPCLAKCTSSLVKLHGAEQRVTFAPCVERVCSYTDVGRLPRMTAEARFALEMKTMCAAEAHRRRERTVEVFRSNAIAPGQRRESGWCTTCGEVMLLL